MFVDWAKNNGSLPGTGAGIKYTHLPEVRPWMYCNCGLEGFNPSPSHIRPAALEMFAGIYAVLPDVIIESNETDEQRHTSSHETSTHHMTSTMSVATSSAITAMHHENESRTTESVFNVSVTPSADNINDTSTVVIGEIGTVSPEDTANDETSGLSTTDGLSENEQLDEPSRAFKDNHNAYFILICCLHLFCMPMYNSITLTR